MFVLEQILMFCRRVEQYVELFGENYEDFARSTAYQDCCALCIIQIGEHCKRVSEEIVDAKPEIEWSGWCKTRDFLTHQYINLDVDILWDVINNDIPKIKEVCEDFLK
ncbi:MAG: DUF86 domain-containing protein [Methanobrevibacter sp.]|uniref:HepT-like ribonuclease domain-containing protein n=1 Tax=Methanobrevibacter sp. TaxID=66852 RepID=UPI0026DFE440|nr:HepT-like ribonuclease domain-containing protein [Methanobrevibacter sp.]MDO5848541.1 DUF86 domain-containing protein [Methanobrevibacter sp.]